MKLRFVFAMMFLSLAAPATFAHDYRQGNLLIDHPWTRPTPPGTPMGVGYLSITNNGNQPVVLVGASTPRALSISIHESSMQEGMMQMRPVEDGLTVEPGASVALEPHGYHLMLEKLTSPLREGESIPVTLEFEGAGDMAVELNVESLDGPAMPTNDGGMHGGEGIKHSGQGMNHSGH